MFACIMAPARRAGGGEPGAGWGRQGPGAPPPPALTIANVQLNSDGPTALIQLMDLFIRSNFKLKVENLREI